MKTNETIELLISLANSEQEKIDERLPDNPIERLILFIETIRISDYLLGGSSESLEESGFSIPKLHLMKMGWNFGAGILFKPISLGGIPLAESTEKSRSLAASLLYDFGKSSLLRRVAEMAKAGIVTICEFEDTYTITFKDESKSQFLDQVDIWELDNLEIQLQHQGNYKGWGLVNKNEIDTVFEQTGNFLGVRAEDRLTNFEIEGIEQIMKPLVKPWDSGRGIMMSYDSTPEIDNHFFQKAAKLVNAWKDDAGFHPSLKHGNVKGHEILVVLMIITSFHLKHLKFASIASELFPEISIPQSLTIWNPVVEFIKDISELSGIGEKSVKEILTFISLNCHDSEFIKNHTSWFMTPLVSLENGYVLRPISSLVRNPLHSISALLESRDPTFRDRKSMHRENWLREYLYSMFKGTRYQRVEGNIKLRENGKIVTDLDAVIFDCITGELAIFQLKWQDYHTNNVRQLRSKAKNLTHEINKWASKVDCWISQNGEQQLIQSLRIKGGKSISEIFLFALSKEIGRTSGYGFPLKNSQVAIGSWAQFVKNRIEIGPAARVIESLFQELRRQENAEIKAIPISLQFSIGKKNFDFKGLWNQF